MSEGKDNQKKRVDKDREAGSDSEHMPFGNFFRGIGNLIEFVARLDEEGKEERRAGEYSSPGGLIKAAFNFSIKTGLEEKLKTSLEEKLMAEPRNLVRKTLQRPVVEGERQPFVDVFDEHDHVLIIIELPGVEEEDIHIDVSGDILTLSTVSGDYPYVKEVVLPAEVDASTRTSKYKNGILEIRVSKK